MQLTFYGHSTLSITVNGKTILFDPFFTGNPSAKNIDIEKIKWDYIFVTGSTLELGNWATTFISLPM